MYNPVNPIKVIVGGGGSLGAQGLDLLTWWRVKNRKLHRLVWRSFAARTSFIILSTVKWLEWLIIKVNKNMEVWFVTLPTLSLLSLKWQRRRDNTSSTIEYYPKLKFKYSCNSIRIGREINIFYDCCGIRVSVVRSLGKLITKLHFCQTNEHFCSWSYVWLSLLRKQMRLLDNETACYRLTSIISGNRCAFTCTFLHRNYDYIMITCPCRCTVIDHQREGLLE